MKQECVNKREENMWHQVVLTLLHVLMAVLAQMRSYDAHNRVWTEVTKESAASNYRVAKLRSSGR
jgi:hypothetical protein